MAGESWIELWIAVGALAGVAIAAAVEALVGLVGKERLRELADGPGGRRRTIEDLLGPRRTLSAALIAVQAIGLVVAASVLTSLYDREVGGGEHVLAVATVLVVYVVIGLGVPSALRRYRRDESPGRLAWIAALLGAVARPMTAAGERVGRWLEHLLPAPRPADSSVVGFEDELAPLLGVAEATGAIEATERAMIQGILDLEERTVHEIMVPRVDITAVELGVPPAELIETIVGAGHSRIPVYRESIDQIVGILYAKDLMPFVLSAAGSLPLVDLVRPPYFVPESKRVNVLLREMRRARMHIAIVVDEYGGTAGLVTIEDILEEIVGEIQDEHDVEPPLLQRLDERTIVADARLPLGDIEEATGIRFPEDDDYDSLGGYVLTQLGRLPRSGDRFEDPGVRLTVEILAVEGRRVRQVRLTQRHDDDPPERYDDSEAVVPEETRQAAGVDDGAGEIADLSVLDRRGEDG